MTWEEIDGIIERSKLDPVSDELAARSIASNSRIDPYYAFMRRLVREANPKGVFLEIGCYQGVVAAYIADAKGYHENIYLGVDINPIPFSDKGIVCIQGDSTDPEVRRQIADVAEAFGGIFAVFQDSSHHYDASVKEWEMYSPLVRPGGIWLSDDVTESFYRPGLDAKSMAGYFSDLPGDKRVYDDLHVGSKIGIVLL